MPVLFIANDALGAVVEAVPSSKLIVLLAFLWILPINTLFESFKIETTIYFVTLYCIACL